MTGHPQRRGRAASLTGLTDSVSYSGPMIGCMARKTWTAEELEKLTPQEQDDVFEASIVGSLDEVPEDFLERVRSRHLDRTATDSPDTR